MVVLKGCTRCAGDLLLERGIGESDLVCLQCGRRWRLRQPDAVAIQETVPQSAA